MIHKLISLSCILSSFLEKVFSLPRIFDTSEGFYRHIYHDTLDFYTDIYLPEKGNDSTSDDHILLTQQ